MRAQDEIDALQRKGMIKTRRLAIQLKQAANAALKSGEVPDMRAAILGIMTPTLRDAMLASHLRGLLAERAIMQAGKAGKGAGLKLSIFDNVIGGLKKLLNINTRALQLQYQTQAIRVLQDVSDEVDKQLRKTVNELVEAGAHVREGVRVIGQKLSTLGMTPKADYRLEAIFRTQTQLAYGAGRWEADQDPAVQEILWGYTYSAVMDSRTRPEHAALDGTTLPKEDPIWERIWPPNGWNCRCQVIPIFEPEPEKRPEEIDVDPGFAFNPGRVFSSLRTDPKPPPKGTGLSLHPFCPTNGALILANSRSLA